MDTIIIRGEINQDMYLNVIAQARGIVGDSVTVDIDSPGGNEAISDNIANYLQLLGKKITTVQTGIVASAAVKIFLTGETRKANANFPFLIHNTHVDPQSINVNLDANNAQRLADMLNESRVKLASYYAEKTGNKPEAILGVMQADEPMTAQQAMALGFATEVTNEIPILAKIQMSKLQEYIEKIKANFAPAAPAQPAPVKALAVGDPAMKDGQPLPDGEHDMGDAIVVVKDGKVAAINPKAAAPTQAQFQALEGSVTALAEAVSNLSQQFKAKADEQKKAFDLELTEIKNSIKGQHTPPKKSNNMDQPTADSKEWDALMAKNKILSLRKDDPEKFKALYEAKFGTKPNI